MAGHSQFKNIMHRKGAQDAKKAKIFNKIARKITVACKNGLPDPAANPSLRAAIIEARKENMPRERIDRAMKAAQPGADTAIYDEVRYEGYGPGGVALILEILTDNRNRAASEIRLAFSKHGGTLGETGSVSFMFNRVGQIIYPIKVASADTMLEAAIDAGADNVESGVDYHEITTSVDDLGAARDALEKKFNEADSVKLIWKPQTLTPVTGEPAAALLKLLDALDDNDDVQAVYGNYDIAESELEKLTA